MIEAFEEVVARQVVPGRTTLSDLGGLLDAASWLGDEDVVRVEALGGKLPVTWSPDATVVAVTLPGGGAALYLALDGELSAGQVAAGLRGTGDARSAVIREAAIARGS
jgi:hypothetical protein